MKSFLLVEQLSQGFTDVSLFSNPNLPLSKQLPKKPFVKHTAGEKLNFAKSLQQTGPFWNEHLMLSEACRDVLRNVMERNWFFNVPSSKGAVNIARDALSKTKACVARSTTSNPRETSIITGFLRLVNFWDERKYFLGKSRFSFKWIYLRLTRKTPQQSTATLFVSRRFQPINNELLWQESAGISQIVELVTK